MAAGDPWGTIECPAKCGNAAIPVKETRRGTGHYACPTCRTNGFLNHKREAFKGSAAAPPAKKAPAKKKAPAAAAAEPNTTPTEDQDHGKKKTGIGAAFGFE